MTTGCTQSLDRYDWIDDWYYEYDDLYACLDDRYVFLMTSQGDTDLCDQINMLKWTLV